MQRISSGQTFFLKRILPILAFGFAALFVGVGLFRFSRPLLPMLVVPPLVMAAVLFVLFRKFFWDLADEVRDAGDALVVRRGAIEERIPLANVMNVSLAPTNPPRLTLRLREPGRLGRDVAFVAKAKARFRFHPFAGNELFDDLVERIDRARSTARR